MLLAFTVHAFVKMMKTGYALRSSDKNFQPGRVGTAHHGLMLIASVIGRIQRFIAMFDPVSIPLLGRDQEKWWAVPTLHSTGGSWRHRRRNNVFWLCSSLKRLLAKCKV